MITFFLYLMKSVLCLALFYPFYMVLLSRETFHRFNRMALISILLASVIIPACRITTEEPMLLSQLYQRWEHWLTGQEAVAATVVADAGWADMELAMPFIDDAPEVAPVFSPGDFLSEHWGDLLFLLYVAGILFLIGRHAASLVRLFSLLRQGKMQRLDDGTRLYLHQQSDIAPFSWMKYIVISEADYRENGRQIVAHEQAHISNHHSWDLLLVEVCLLAQWFNPAAWLLRQELQNVHEYEADDTVLRQGINAKEYQLLIIKKAVGARLYSLANSLNHSSLKQRLTMMMKEKSHPWARLKYLYVLPLAAISMVAFAHTEAANNSNGISEAKGTEVSANDQTSMAKFSEKGRKVLIVVDGELAAIQDSEQNDYTEEDLAGLGGIAPEEIAQIEMIKKPKILAQWNVPGATEAILVTTKKAKAADETAEAAKEKFTVTVNDAGEYSYGPMGSTLKKGTLDDIYQYIRDMQRKLQADGEGRHFLVNVEASPKAPRESVEKVKETLRKAWALRITYSQKEEKETVVDHLILIGKPKHNEKEGNIEVERAEEVFMIVENMPEFPGGNAELMKYLATNIKYPTEAKLKGEQGRVVVSFIVGKDGKLRDFEVKRSVSTTLDAEAIRVCKTMPAWKPGTQRGQAVDCRFTLPVSFSLQGTEADKEGANVIQVVAFSEDLHGPKQAPACIVLVDSKGGYQYGAEGTMKEGSLEEVANYVNDRRKESNSAGNGAHFKVQIVADKGAPQESVDKLKETLRGIYVLQMDYRRTDPDEVFQVVEKMPQFPGGMGELMNYLTKTVKYPKAAMRDSIQGRVIVQFVISKTGKVTNPSIMRSVSPELDAEAVRVVNSMPLWTPGEQKGVPVNVKFTLPIQFRLASPKGMMKKEAEKIARPNELTVMGQTKVENKLVTKDSEGRVLSEVMLPANATKEEIDAARKRVVEEIRNTSK